MAFLDNSGDIILDAVLTDTGRRRLAEAANGLGSAGAARISHFALGDDDINYSQYDLNNPSGSNYADLSILQTPVLEAFTQDNANINYGLLSLPNPSILYLPALVVNEKQSGTTFPAMQSKSGVFYLAVNTTTWDTLVNTEAGIGATQVMAGDPTSGGSRSPFVFVEGGIDSALVAKTTANRNSYITNMGTSNTTYVLGVDSRLGGSVYTLNNGIFANNASNADSRTSFSVKITNPNYAGYMGLENYNFYSCASVVNGVLEPQSGGSATQYSAIGGVGDTVTCFKFLVPTPLSSDGTAGGLRDVLYDQLGQVGVSSAVLFGSAGRTYDYIDTMVYLFGTTTGAMISIPIRIIRRAT